jgi:hypothetical protein
MFAPLGSATLLPDYFLSGGPSARPPVGVASGSAPSARLPTQPGQPVPRGTPPFPVSSQKPGNREGNQRIPYARYMYTWPDDTAAPRALQFGDVLFVHKAHAAMGRSTNRMTKSTGIAQLNAMLSNRVAGVTTLDFSDPGISARIREARVRHARAEYETALHSGDGAAKERKKLEAEQKAKAVTSVKEVDVYRDWRAVQTLEEWTLDGVLIGVDDGETESGATDARNDGVVLNVCIQGPTPTRNATRDLVHVHFDDGLLVADKVFVGLFGKMQKDVWTFKYKPFSGRQLLMTPANFDNLVGAWRLGSVMDNKLSRGENRMMLVNVCCEWWSIDRLRAFFFAPPPPKAVAVAAAVAVEEVEEVEEAVEA